MDKRDEESKKEEEKLEDSNGEPTIEEELTDKEKKSHKEKKLEEEIATLRLERDHWKNEYYRAYADTQNLRKTLQKDHEEAIKYRAEGFVEGLLPVLDSFYMVLSATPPSEEVKNYCEGFAYIYKNLVSVLESEGVSEIAPKIGDKFDPNLMIAIESEEDSEPNIVKKVYSRGYSLHGRVIRPAGVKVSVVPTKDEKENKESKETTITK
ncbi:MAG: nucleotide exchange factor GrpE [Coprobacillus sp.]|nr:nucleotide exchange factor GrpE [Coprobacillus sp.]